MPPSLLSRLRQDSKFRSGLQSEFQASLRDLGKISKHTILQGLGIYNLVAECWLHVQGPRFKLGGTGALLVTIG